VSPAGNEGTREFGFGGMEIRGFVSSLLQSGNGKKERQTEKKFWAKGLDWMEQQVLGTQQWIPHAHGGSVAGVR
jgi:hypothetical protein